MITKKEKQVQIVENEDSFVDAILRQADLRLRRDIYAPTIVLRSIPYGRGSFEIGNMTEKVREKAKKIIQDHGWIVREIGSGHEIYWHIS